MSGKNWNAIAIGAGITAAGEAFVGFGLWFSPGWANGWPFGISIHVAWPAGLAAYLFVFLMTVVVALIAAENATEIRRRQPPLGARALTVFLAVAAFCSLVACVGLYPHLHASALAMWPNGYNWRPGQLGR